MNDDETKDEKALRAKWQREWRARRDKIGATLYLSRSEIDILDWMASRLMEENPESPHVVGRPAVIRALLSEVMDQHGDEIIAWSMAAPEPGNRAREFQKELGKRRRGPNYAEFQNLPRHRQQAIARTARNRSLAALREQRRLGREVEFLRTTLAGSDPDA